MATGNHSFYNSDTAKADLADVIAQETSGISGALPEPEDFELADIFVKIINSDFRQDMDLLRRMLSLVI